MPRKEPTTTAGEGGAGLPRFKTVEQ